jgi:phage-related minor tail protein
VRFQRVARDAVDVGAGLLELLEGVAEIRTLLRAAGSVVAGVEVQDQLASALGLEAEGAAAGRGKAEILDRLAYGFQSFESLFSNSP